MFKKFFNKIAKNSNDISNKTLGLGVVFIIISALFDTIAFYVSKNKKEV